MSCCICGEHHNLKSGMMMACEPCSSAGGTVHSMCAPCCVRMLLLNTNSTLACPMCRRECEALRRLGECPTGCGVRQLFVDAAAQSGIPLSTFNSIFPSCMYYLGLLRVANAVRMRWAAQAVHTCMAQHGAGVAAPVRWVRSAAVIVLDRESMNAQCEYCRSLIHAATRALVLRKTAKVKSRNDLLILADVCTQSGCTWMDVEWHQLSWAELLHHSSRMDMSGRLPMSPACERIQSLQAAGFDMTTVTAAVAMVVS